MFKRLLDAIGRLVPAARRARLERHDWYPPHLLHWPERLPDESQAQYRERQRLSREVAWVLEHGPHQEPAKDATDFRRFWLGQHTNRARAWQRKHFRLFGRRKALSWMKTFNRLRKAEGKPSFFRELRGR